MRIFANANYEFIGRRRTAYKLSAVLLLLGLGAAIYWQVARGSWLDYGVDFTGGTLVQVQFREATSVSELRGLIAGAVPGTDVTRFGAENEFLIRAPQFSEGGRNISDQIDQLLEQRFGDAYTVVRTEAVGPRVGQELQQKAIFAILISFAFTLIYLAFRFEWRFGVAAVIATVHDILLTIGFITAFQLEVSLTTVAAVLTIIGYSLNDTIIVFDRVRENLKKTGRREDTKTILDRSINETLPRTIMTSMSTLAVLLALFVLGGEIIREFALILIVGIVFGTYSSIFVASPALLEIERRWGARKAEKKSGERRPQRAAV